MLIFDGFPIKSKAEQFAIHVATSYNREAIVCMTESEARKHDVFPFPVIPPIVMVERNEHSFEDEEQKIIQDAKLVFGGEFAGT